MLTRIVQISQEPLTPNHTMADRSLSTPKPLGIITFKSFKQINSIFTGKTY